MRFLILLLVVCMATTCTQAQPASEPFEWPDNNIAAVSLTFDDARHSQVDRGTALLNKFGAKATFYVVPSAVEERLNGWKQAVATGHEIANHSLVHPCSGNFLWSRNKAIETYTQESMREELIQASKRLEELLGVTPTSFAYPCGQTTVGRGVETKSYVPVVADLFKTGRGWLDEAPNDPMYVDMAQLTGMKMDGKDFEEIIPMLESAKEEGLWLILAGHEMADAGDLTTRLTMLEKLIPYLQDPANGFWFATVDDVASYVLERR